MLPCFGGSGCQVWEVLIDCICGGCMWLGGSVGGGEGGVKGSIRSDVCAGGFDVGKRMNACVGSWQDRKIPCALASIHGGATTPPERPHWTPRRHPRSFRIAWRTPF